jgi:hypothetical protein
MRRLRLVVSTSSKGAVPMLLLATLLPAAVADCSAIPDAPAGAGGGTTAAAQGPGGAGGTGSAGGDVFAAVSSVGAGGADWCTTFTVEVPPEGTPATPGAICAVVMSPVESNDAARVKLTKYSTALNLATGFVEIDPALAGTIVGLPAISVLSAALPELLPMNVTDVQTTAGGFSFHADWPPFTSVPEPWAELTVKVTMQIACDPLGTDLRTIESITHIHLCLGEGDLTWVSSGDECKVCEIIAEMAPSPIVSALRGDNLPLGRALRLRIVMLARIGRTLVLFAENDGGPGLTYAWRSTGGATLELTPDVVVWTPPASPGPHLIQAAVHGDDEAMVASFTFQEAA